MWSADKKSSRGEDNKEYKTEKEKRPSENSSVTTSVAARGRRVGAVDIALRRKPFFNHASADHHQVCGAELLTILL